MWLKMYLYICSFDDCIFCNGYCMIIIYYVFIYRCQSVMTAFFFKSLHLHYRDMHWNSIESAQAGFCAYIKKKNVKGGSCP